MSLIADVVWYYAERAHIYNRTAGFLDAEAEKLREPIKARDRDFFRGRNVLEIACGTGYWTAVIAETAASVTGIDINARMIKQACKRCICFPNVQFRIADAYTLANVPAGFDSAAGFWWWSHMPRAAVRTFLTALHSKLAPGATVRFVDHLPYPGFNRRTSESGDTLEERKLPLGRKIYIVKNFPTQQEVRDALADYGEGVTYTARDSENSWEVTYRTSVKEPPGIQS